MNIENFNKLSIKIMEMIKFSPARDVERNLNALLQGAFTKLDLISRSEFDVQADLLRVTRQNLDDMHHKLEAAEKTIVLLENVLHKSNSVDGK